AGTITRSIDSTNSPLADSCRRIDIVAAVLLETLSRGIVMPTLQIPQLISLIRWVHTSGCLLLVVRGDLLKGRAAPEMTSGGRLDQVGRGLHPSGGMMVIPAERDRNVGPNLNPIHARGSFSSTSRSEMILRTGL